MSPFSSQPAKTNGGAARDYHTYYFSELLNRRVYAETVKKPLGRLSDLVVRLSETFPETVGIYLEHGWGKPTEFIPWERVLKIDPDGVFVQAPPAGDQYPPFIDQPGWMLLNEHLMGKTILDMDGRRTEVVNDIHLLESQKRMIIAHVDVSFRGFLRKWGLGRLSLVKERLIGWRYVQPLSLEDAAASDSVSLSITRNSIRELPAEDLADALEELSGKQQQAVFSALDSEKAADTLFEAEPRAQRQIVASLRMDRARSILSEMSVPQLADLLSVVPLDDRRDLMALLPPDLAERIESVLSEYETEAASIMSGHYVAMPGSTPVGEAIRQLREGKYEHDEITYIYIVGEGGVLQGVVDVREALLAPAEKPLSELMAAPVVAAEGDDTRDDLAELFAKYHYRMIPVVDAKDHVLGVVHYNDVMKGLVMRAKT